MTGSPPRPARWPDVLIVLAAVALATATVSWADREFLRAEPPTEDPPPHMASRPDWIRALHHPYRRLQHAAVWISAAATLGVGALLARDGRTWSRRGLARPGTTVVLVTLAIGGATVAHRLLTGRPPSNVQAAGISYDLSNALDNRLPGAILGAWVVAWLGPRGRSRPDWRERAARLVGWAWMANVGLLIAYGPLFG